MMLRRQRRSASRTGPFATLQALSVSAVVYWYSLTCVACTPGILTPSVLAPVQAAMQWAGWMGGLHAQLNANAIDWCCDLR